MSQPNALEKSIIEGAKEAQEDYENMSGWWLSHGPEYFLTSIVSNWLCKKSGFYVYPEASPKKIAEEHKRPRQEQPSKMQGKRFDIVVWNKSNIRLRAIIEIKLAWSIRPLIPDRNKMRGFLSTSEHKPTCYLLVYTTAKGPNRVETLKRRFMHWEKKLECNLVHEHVDTQGDGEFSWALALLRLQ